MSLLLLLVISLHLHEWFSRPLYYTFSPYQVFAQYMHMFSYRTSKLFRTPRMYYGPLCSCHMALIFFSIVNKGSCPVTLSTYQAFSSLVIPANFHMLPLFREFSRGKKFGEITDTITMNYYTSLCIMNSYSNTRLFNNTTLFIKLC